MPAQPLLERLKRARIVQVLAVYLGASWVVLQIADVLTEALSLPDWVLPVCVLSDEDLSYARDAREGLHRVGA